MVAAVVFLAAYAVPILHPDLPSGLLDWCRWLSWITWGIFVVDILVRLFLADERLRYLVRHWYDVLVLALPLLRPLRLLRLIPLLSVLNRRATIRLRGRVGIYVAGGASLLAFCAALAVLDAERSSPDANIVSVRGLLAVAGSGLLGLVGGAQLDVRRNGLWMHRGWRSAPDILAALRLLPMPRTVSALTRRGFNRPLEPPRSLAAPDSHHPDAGAAGLLP
jgi:hypothetical protein